jgi:hypothetical protein
LKSESANFIAFDRPKKMALRNRMIGIAATRIVISLYTTDAHHSGERWWATLRRQPTWNSRRWRHHSTGWSTERRAHGGGHRVGQGARAARCHSRSRASLGGRCCGRRIVGHRRIAELLPWNIALASSIWRRRLISAISSAARASETFLRLARVGIDFLSDPAQGRLVQVDLKRVIELGKLRPQHLINEAFRRGPFQFCSC